MRSFQSKDEDEHQDGDRKALQVNRYNDMSAVMHSVSAMSVPFTLLSEP